MPWWPSVETRDHRLSLIGLDDEGEFTKTSTQIDLAANGAASLSEVFATSDSYLGVVRQGRKVQVVSFGTDARPAVVQLSKVAPDFSIEEPKNSVVLKGYWYSYGAGNSVHYEAASDTLTFVQGVYGVTQAKVVR